MEQCFRGVYFIHLLDAASSSEADRADGWFDTLLIAHKGRQVGATRRRIQNGFAVRTDHRGRFPSRTGLFPGDDVRLDGGQRGQGQSPASSVTLDQLRRMSPAEWRVLPKGSRRRSRKAAFGGRPCCAGTRAPGRWPWARGWSGRARSSSPASPRPSTASSGCGSFGDSSIKGPSWLDALQRSCLTIARPRASTPAIAMRSDRSPPMFLGLMYDRTTSPPGLSMYLASRVVGVRLAARLVGILLRG